MKKQFLTLLSVFVLLLAAGATVAIININIIISNLDDLVGRYQKERKCTKILMAIKEVQQDGFLHHTYDPIGAAEMDKRISTMGNIINTCSSCHHPQPIAERINTLILQADDFQQALTTTDTNNTDPSHMSIDLQTYTLGHDLYEYAQSLFTKSTKQLAQETQFVRSLTMKNKRLIYFIVWSGLLMVIIAAIILMRCFTKPLQHLLDATEKIHQGNLDYRILGLKYEFGALASAFNDMAASLQTQMRQLQRNEQLATCGKIATTLVHEIRNPLAGIKVAMEVLHGESSISHADREILLKVVKEANLIEGLLTNMLEFARPNPPQYTSVQLNEIIDHALRFTPGVIKKRIRVDWEREKLPPVIQADPHQLGQVLLNLFINAEAAMAPHGGTIFITITADKTTIQITVADSGPGIDDSYFNDIFNPFFTTKAKGSGLGLASCKSLIELHNGTITASNRPEGGAIFTITLPLTEGLKNAS